jgi:hypothetical protein
MKDGTEEGRRCCLFDYTGRNVVTITVFEKMLKDEMARVRSLPGTGGGWVGGRRVAGKLWEGDLLKKTIKIGVGNGVRWGILSDYGVCTIGEFRNMSDERTQLIVGGGTLTSKVLTTIQNHLKDARVGHEPAKIDYKKADNPYESRYGSAWEVNIQSMKAFKKVTCITKMVDHMVTATRVVMKRTMYENYFYFYPDTLSQMTCSKTKKMTTTTGDIKHWILPLNDLNAGATSSKRPPYNSPDFMPLDNSLYNDAQHCVNRYVMITEALLEYDDTKLSLSTQRR